MLHCLNDWQKLSAPHLEFDVCSTIFFNNNAVGDLGMLHFRKIFSLSGCIMAAAIAPSANSADLVQGGSYARGGASAYSAGYRVEECGLLRIIQYNRDEIVRVCHPPLDLNPRTGPVPGSSGGMTGTLAVTYSVQ